MIHAVVYISGAADLTYILSDQLGYFACTKTAGALNQVLLIHWFREYIINGDTFVSVRELGHDYIELIYMDILGACFEEALSNLNKRIRIP